MSQLCIQQQLQRYSAVSSLSFSCGVYQAELPRIVCAAHVPEDLRAGDVLCGVQAHWCHAEQLMALRREGVRVWEWAEWGEDPVHLWTLLLQDAAQAGRRIAIHCDLSAVEAAVVVGVERPEPCGIAPRQLQAMMKTAGAMPCVEHVHFSGWDDAQPLPHATAALLAQCVWYVSQERA